MANKIKPVGISINSWTDWRSPADIRRENIPPYPGVYQLAAFTAASIYTLPAAGGHYAVHKEESDTFEGIVYTGKAVCLQERFWLMVQSWQSNKARAKHGSRKSYNGNHKCAKTHFKVTDLKVRYKAIGSVDWFKFREKLRKARDPGASWLEALAAIWPDLGGRGNSASNPEEYSTVNATFVAERSLLQKFHTAFGCLPLLNKRGPDSMGPEADDSFVYNWIAAEEAAMESIPCDDGIRFRAFEKWRERRNPVGDDWKDWLDAEAELWDCTLLNDWPQLPRKSPAIEGFTDYPRATSEDSHS